MSDKNTDAYRAPQMVDKRTSPPGIVPKNAQALVIAGIAAVMVLAIWLSSGKTPKEKPPAPTVTNTVIDPNALRIQEYKKRLEEETRKLETEQAQLARRQQAVEAASAGPSGVTNPISLPGDYSRSYARPEESGIRAEKDKREYESLFASNVALT